ncbi:MAG: PD-(D/E)XK nuclease family transposase [Planctomycetaceae bacterium]
METGIDPKVDIAFKRVFAGKECLELPKFHKSVSELSSDLDRWTYFLQHGNELDPDALPPSLETPAVHLAAKVLQTMSHDTLERHQYEARLRFLRDQATSLAFAEEKGREDEARRMVIRIGTTRLGPPPGEIIARLNLIKSLERIESLGDRILDCPDWNSLLEGVSE